jgi:hypothetical protein
LVGEGVAVTITVGGGFVGVKVSGVPVTVGVRVGGVPVTVTEGEGVFVDVAVHTMVGRV